ncbi:LuxR C-terminal-related transcriptional regulator [Actinomycetospora endophytica]|uniref:LuxR C-terminal-related transcriptional regulator n=1 Tax=Actinomycetospora endophytica TaxID=2291215 RepID=A0ABS8P7I1_9PSEU|nr:LuxR C-terminal-related transcriptional regulator [Actinomycetospora endophytica]MCD2194211.1 LuxR C-terminal-related transcriptional regulator [Actinomycetospora endophytica]
MGRTCVVHDAREQARHRLELLLRAHADVDEIIATADDDDLLARAGEGPTELVVLGISRTGDPAGMVRRIREVSPTTAVLLAGAAEDAGSVAAALAAGAVGFLRWEAPRALVRTLVQVAGESSAGEDLLPLTAAGPGEDARSGEVRVDLGVQRSLGLSVREVQVLIGVGRGLTNADIGRRLYLSGQTVKTHATRLFRKLGATDRAEAVGRAWALGLFIRI